MGKATDLLSELVVDQEADFFALLTEKQQLTTRDGKPYFRVTFRDALREVSFPIWNDSPWAVECRDSWSPGGFYKLRAVYRESNYGPQLEIRRIRIVCDDDRADGFDPAMCLPRSRFNPEEMFAELVSIAREKIDNAALSALTVDLLESNREVLLALPAAKRNHHAMVGGYLEHVLSVTRTCVYLAQKYADYYNEMQPPLRHDLVIAGAILHDIGKLRELSHQPTGADYTAEGHLIGHILQGRDMVREISVKHSLDAETLLRLEHVIVAHQRLPEWGAPKPPMTPEALIVHYADDLDAKLHMMIHALQDDSSEGPVTSTRNPLYQRLYRGER
ncbi:MAG: HD domain-containing protein [Pirellulales bacterium]